MTFTHALSTNNYGPRKLIVATNAANGTHTTLASALLASSFGDTIELRDSVTENVTIPSGLNINGVCGPTGLNVPTITGKITMTAAGTSTLSNLILKTNSDDIIVVSGSSASILNVNNCYLDCSNSTGISLTSSSASSQIFLYGCKGNLGTTGIALFSVTGSGSLNGYYCKFGNSGSSLTASTISSGTATFVYCDINSAITTSGSSTFGSFHCNQDTSAYNITALTCGGSGTHNAINSSFASGSASAISIDTSSILTGSNITVNSTNINPITGSGQIISGVISFSNTGNTINTTTRTARYSDLTAYIAPVQPAFSAYLPSTDSNVTGNGTTWTLGSTTALTEIFDVGGNFVTTGTFTAPLTGKYQLNLVMRNNGSVSITSGALTIVTSNRNYLTVDARNATTATWGKTLSVLADMDANDTATFTISTTGAGADTDDMVGGANVNCGCSGWLVA